MKKTEAACSSFNIQHSTFGFRLVPLLERVKRCRHLLGSRPLPVVAFDFGPADLSVAIENEHRRTRNAVQLLMCVRRIAQSVAVDGLCAGIEKKGESEISSSVFGDLHRQFTALRGPVETDGEDVDCWKGTSQRSKSDDLPDAVRSPITTIKDKNHLPSARGGEADGLSVLVGELELGRGLSHGWRPHRLGSSESRRKRTHGSQGQQYD